MVFDRASQLASQCFFRRMNERPRGRTIRAIRNEPRYSRLREMLRVESLQVRGKQCRTLSTQSMQLNASPHVLPLRMPSGGTIRNHSADASFPVVNLAQIASCRDLKLPPLINICRQPRTPLTTPFWKEDTLSVSAVRRKQRALRPRRYRIPVNAADNPGPSPA